MFLSKSLSILGFSGREAKSAYLSQGLLISFAIFAYINFSASVCFCSFLFGFAEFFST